MLFGCPGNRVLFGWRVRGLARLLSPWVKNQSVGFFTFSTNFVSCGGTLGTSGVGGAHLA